jgi:hypothetical protein
MTIMTKLPFDLMADACDGSDGQLILVARNSRTGCLRSTKPFKRVDFNDDSDRAVFEASANYVWRMLCFDFVAYRPHSCIPVMADCDVAAVYYSRWKRGEYASRDDSRDVGKAVLKALDATIKLAESVMPLTAQKGVMMALRGLV